MLVKIGKGKDATKADVLDVLCPCRPCFSIGLDRGPYTPGRGYTATPKVQRYVCNTRHIRGCPVDEYGNLPAVTEKKAGE